MSRSGLVLFSYKSHKHGYIEKLFDVLRERALRHGIPLDRSALKELHISIVDGHLHITDPLTEKELNEFAVVYLELWYKRPQQALAVATYCERQNIPYLSKELATIVPETKVGESAILADSGVSIPDTLSTSRSQFKDLFSPTKLTHPFSYPFVLKADDGYGGNNNYLIKDHKMLIAVLDENRDLTFVAQAFIPNDCDYRCLVLGGEIRFVLRRSRTNSETHLNNTSAGAEGIAVPQSSLSPAAQADVVKAAKVLNRDQFAGVDLIINKETGQHYILEVNQTPQIEIGAEVEKKMDALIDYMRELGGARW